MPEQDARSAPEPTPSPGVWLGVDVGSVRVGVAVSDPRGVLATPVETLARTASTPPAAGDADVEAVAGLVLEHGAVGVVVGCHVHSAGTKVPPRSGPARMLRWLRNASHPSGSGSSTSGSAASTPTAHSGTAGSQEDGSVPWSTRPRP